MAVLGSASLRTGLFARLVSASLLCVLAGGLTLGCVSGEPSAATFPPAFEGPEGAATEKAVMATFERHAQGKALAAFRSRHQKWGVFPSTRGDGVRLTWATYRGESTASPAGRRPELVFLTGLTDSFTRNLETIHDLHAAGRRRVR